MPTSGPRLTLRKSSCPMIPMLRRFRACWICRREDRSRLILYTMGAKNDGNGLTCPSLSVHSIHRRGVIIVSFFFDVLMAMCLDPVNRTTWGRKWLVAHPVAILSFETMDVAIFPTLATEGSPVLTAQHLWDPLDTRSSSITTRLRPFQALCTSWTAWSVAFGKLRGQPCRTGPFRGSLFRLYRRYVTYDVVVTSSPSHA